MHLAVWTPNFVNITREWGDVRFSNWYHRCVFCLVVLPSAPTGHGRWLHLPEPGSARGWGKRGVVKLVIFSCIWGKINQNCTQFRPAWQELLFLKAEHVIRQMGPDKLSLGPVNAERRSGRRPSSQLRRTRFSQRSDNWIIQTSEMKRNCPGSNILWAHVSSSFVKKPKVVWKFGAIIHIPSVLSWRQEVLLLFKYADKFRTGCSRDALFFCCPPGVFSVSSETAKRQSAGKPGEGGAGGLCHRVYISVFLSVFYLTKQLFICTNSLLKLLRIK